MREWVDYPRLATNGLPKLSQRSLCEIRAMRKPPAEIHRLVCTVLYTLGYNDALVIRHLLQRLESTCTCTRTEQHHFP